MMNITRLGKVRVRPSILYGEATGLYSKSSGWLHTLRNCCTTFMTETKSVVLIFTLPECDMNSS